MKYSKANNKKQAQIMKKKIPKNSRKQETKEKNKRKKN